MAQEDKRDTLTQQENPPEPPAASEETVVEDNAAKPEKTGQNPVERMYDKIPLTYKQVDLLVKFLGVLLLALLVYGWLAGSGSPRR